MTIKLRHSTSGQEIPLGYFVDNTDGNTEETGLTINNTDIKLWKNGATSLTPKNSGGATHINNGIYYCTLDDTDTNTLGALVIFVHVSGALPVRVECEVLPANVYDSLIANTDKLESDAVQFGGNALNDYSAELLLKHVGIINTDANVPALYLESTNGNGMEAIGGSGGGMVVTGTNAAGAVFIGDSGTSQPSIEAVNGIVVEDGGLNLAELSEAVWELPPTRTLTGIAVKKNTALNNFMFFMKQSADHVSPATGLTVTAERSIDGAAFAACTNSVTEVGNGVYKINLDASDLNGDVIAVKFTAAGADQRTVTIVTQP